MTILIENYCKIITNYDKNLLQITTALLKITTVGYYKLQQLYYKLRQKIYHKLRQKTAANYGSSYFCKIPNYYKLSQFLLQITAAFSFITNYGKF